MQVSLKGRTAVITGGAQGIGLETARLFLQSGASVVVADLQEESLKACEKELKQLGSLVTHRLDVGHRESCKTFAQSLTQPIHILINNAGITRDKSLSKMSDEEFDQVIQTNLTGVYNVTKSLLEKFDPHQNKKIINLASIVALYGNFGQTNYVAAKAGVVGMTKTWARELGRKGFTCNAIAPGFIKTKMTDAMPAEVRSMITDKVPVGRMGEPRDIANACLFLASDAANYINGVVLSVDGGLVF